MSLSGFDHLIAAIFTFEEIENHDPKFMQEVEAAVTHPNVESVYLSGQASADVLLPYIAMLHEHKVPFTVVQENGHKNSTAIEVIRSATL